MKMIEPVRYGQHKLPPLPYAYNALEPVLDEKTMHIHHDILHKGYVDGLNKTEIALADARATNDYSNIQCLENKLAFNGSGHILHSIYWTIMAPPGQGGRPQNLTAQMIDGAFGDFSRFKAQFIQASQQVEASGWGILGYSPSFHWLEILQCEKHQNLTQWGIIPILVCDVWEHAYFLKYYSDRAAYIDSWWTLINWAEVERRLVSALRADLPLRMP